MPNKGYKPTTEHRKKLSVAKMGSKHPFYGKKRPDVSEKNRQRILTKETKEKIRVSMLGKNRGKRGCYFNLKTSLNQAIRTSYKYRQWRSDVYTRDDFTCLECGGRNGSGIHYEMNADHIIPLYELIERFKITDLNEAINCEELWNINNGRTLCRSCHKKTSTYGSRWKNNNTGEIKL